MSASAELPQITGADGAGIRVSIEGATLRVHYEAPEIEQPQHRVFIALDSDPKGGSAVVPFAQRAEGSTVFLPFNADRIYSTSNMVDGAAKTMRIWKTTQWSTNMDVKPELTAEFAAGKCELAINLAELGNPASLGFVIYAK